MHKMIKLKSQPRVEDGSRNVPYTDSEYKIKAAVTDNKYHLTSFRVDNDERLNENRNK